MPAPEAGVPYRNLSLNGAEHDQDQAQRSDLREYTKCDAETAQQFSRSQKRGEALAHADALAAGFEIFQMVPSAADEYQRHHEPEKKYTDVGILCELRKHTCTSAQATRPILLLRMVVPLQALSFIAYQTAPFLTWIPGTARRQWHLKRDIRLPFI